MKKIGMLTDEAAEKMKLAVIFLVPKVKERIWAMLETELYGNTFNGVCETLIMRGIEEAIAKGIIPREGPLKGRE